MALQMNVADSVTIAGRTYTQNATLNGTVVIAGEPTVPIAQAGVVTSGGTTTSGVLTLGTGHGIVTGQVVDLYWGASGAGRLLEATVGTVSGTSVPITATGTFEDGASDLPANTTAIFVSPRISESVGFVGNNLQGIVCNFPGAATFEGTFSFYSSGTLELQVPVQAGNNWTWFYQCGYVNPFAGLTITSLRYSHNETDVPVIMRLGTLVQ